MADWVILTEIDEHLYHRNLTAYLGMCKKRGITIVPALGYQMLCATFPPADQLLCQAVTTGAPWQRMNKLASDAVETLNYAPGRHTARPTGRIVAPRYDRVLLLHYRYLDFERTYRRNQAAAVSCGKPIWRKIGAIDICGRGNSCRKIGSGLNGTSSTFRIRS